MGFTKRKGELSRLNERFTFTNSETFHRRRLALHPERVNRIVLPLFLIAAALAADPLDRVWPQWRGPQRTGHSIGDPWPDQLTALKQLWHVDLDKGYPGPIVSVDRVFVAETANGDTEVVRALDRETGKELWRASWKGKISVPFFAKKNGDWIRSTPSFDGETLYVGGMEEVLVALDAKTGKERWRVDFTKQFNQPKPDFGYASSPLIDGEFLYTQAANAVVKLRKKDGSLVWRSFENKQGMMESGAFSSPVIATLAGKRQLVIASRASMAGLDLENGAALWSQPIETFRGMNIPTPLIHGDSVFTSIYRQESHLFKIKKDGDKFAVEQLWTNKTKGYMSTPVLIGDYLYLHLMSQRATCLDIRTGEIKWTTEPFGTYWSMVARGDKILALDENGKLLLIKANPEKFELLDSREIAKSPTWAHLAVVGNEVFVRELTGITAYRLESVAKISKAE
jgi:outer membrane protein assembly factor BamB